ncbi:MAG: hypothetical protein ABIQ35_09205, partial [Verrucomicrobiota bacterium]
VLRINAVVTNPTGQPFRFSLTNSPAGAMINSTNGGFVWVVTNAPAPGTNSVTVRVEDNGAPPLSGETTFLVIVKPAPQFEPIQLNGSGKLTIRFNTLSGQSYQVQYKDDLAEPDWTAMGATISGTGGILTIQGILTGQRERFYRLVVVD